MCAESVSHSIVTMLLLLLAGDVETNPGPTGLTIDMLIQEFNLTDQKLKIRIVDHVAQLSPFFDRVEDYFEVFSLDLAQQNDVKTTSYTINTQAAMKKALKYRVNRYSTQATFRALIDIVISLPQPRGDIAMNICSYLSKNVAIPHPSSDPLNSRINIIARHHSMDPDLLDRPCADYHLEPIAREIVHWKAYTSYLGVSKQEENVIDTHPKHGLPFAKPLMMLEAWQRMTEGQVESHYRYLLRGILEKEDNAKLVGTICDVIAQYNQPPASFIPPSYMVVKKKKHCIVLQSDKDKSPTQPPLVKKGAGGVIKPGKMWSLPKYKSILVHIINPEALKDVGLSEDTLLNMANSWNDDTCMKGANVPCFVEEKQRENSNIRVYIEIPSPGTKSNPGAAAHSQRPAPHPGATAYPQRPLQQLGATVHPQRPPQKLEASGHPQQHGALLFQCPDVQPNHSTIKQSIGDFSQFPPPHSGTQGPTLFTRGKHDRHTSLQETDFARRDANQASGTKTTIKVAIVGATNSGKSTTLNALLEGRFLPASSGGTTAHVLHIKHDATVPDGKLSGKVSGNVQGDSCPKLPAEGRKPILDAIKKLNKLGNEPDNNLTVSELVLSAKIPILSQKNVTLELYDTPGMSEDKQSPIYQATEQMLEKVDWLVLVLSQDTVGHEATSQLLEKLRSNPFSLMNRGRVTVLMNKYDLFFANNDDEDDEPEDLTEKFEKISKKIEIPLTQVAFYGAKMALEARQWKSDFNSVTKKKFDALKVDVEKLPKRSDAEEELLASCKYSNNVPQLCEIAESRSCLSKVECLISGII